MTNVNQIYKRTEVIGRGKFGTVYKGLHRSTKQVFAIKVLNLDTSEEEVKDVQQEVQFLSHLNHVPNITHYYGSYLNDTKLWIIMDYCAGGSLRTLLKPGKLEEKYIGVIVREVLTALQYIHKQNVIHRDIKAANVLITNEGKVQLCDFGVAAQLTSTSVRRNTMAGTPYWMAPEVIMEGTSYDVKADIWSLGITIFEIATGNPPYCEFEAIRAMQLITKSKPPRLEGKQYSSLLKEIVALCLDENANERLGAEELLKSKFIRFYKNSPTTLLKEIISRYLLWREKKHSRESILMNIEDESSEQNEIEVKWDFDSLSSNEYILENDININNIHLDENDELNDQDADYDDGDDEFMTGYQYNNITYNKNNQTTSNTYTYNNVGSTLKANSTLNRKEAPKSLLNLFEERTEEEEEIEQKQNERQFPDYEIPKIKSSMELHNISNPGTNTYSRVTTPVVEIQIPNMDEIESLSSQQLQQQMEHKSRAKSNTLNHSQSTTAIETRKTLDPAVSRRPTIISTPTTHAALESQPPHLPQVPQLSQPPIIPRGTPSPQGQLHNTTSPGRLNIVTSSPNKSMKAIQSPSNPSPLLQPLNNTVETVPNKLKKNPNLRLQMPTPTSINFPKLLHSTSHIDEGNHDENVNQFGVNVSNVPMTMTPLTEKPGPILSQQKRKLTNSSQPPVFPFLSASNRTVSSVSSHSSNDASKPATNTFIEPLKFSAPNLDMSLFMDSDYGKEKMNEEIHDLLGSVNQILNTMEEKLIAISE
ncbi:hypothetical protein WICMUC_003749 [Wickerhamomyces mucosus]|uniref:non-specific serine/threonine protein kinase n=1 Tax=Wickerhamomyces mucosus TaxID=1378264 RepID=A0A9P8PL59_9ASCO|nr:hypothetical protein WICMUC_003749 [Wickerhamomyces mucosus]